MLIMTSDFFGLAVDLVYWDTCQRRMAELVGHDELTDSIVGCGLPGVPLMDDQPVGLPPRYVLLMDMEVLPL